MPGIVGHHRVAPEDFVGGEVFHGHPAPFLPDRRDQPLGPWARIEVVHVAVGGDPAQRRRQRRLPEVVVECVEGAVFPREDRPRLRAAGEDVGAELDVLHQAGVERHAFLGDADGGLEQVREGDLAEALMARFHTLHESRNQGGAPGRTDLRGHEVADVQARDGHGVVLAGHRVVGRVHVVDGVGFGVVVDQRHDAREADPASRGEGHLRHRGGQRRVHGGAARLEDVQPRLHRGGAGGAHDDALVRRTAFLRRARWFLRGDRRRSGFTVFARGLAWGAANEEPGAHRRRECRSGDEGAVADRVHFVSSGTPPGSFHDAARALHPQH